MSIPIRSNAAGTYYSYGDHEITYNGYLYGFYITSASTSGLPNNYQINQEVFEDIIKSDAKGFQFDLANRIDTYGVKILDWTTNGVENYVNWVYGLYVNATIATNSFIHDFIWSNATTYTWNYSFTGADPDYPGSGDYGTAYGFRFYGMCGEKFDVVLDEYGDYYGHNIIGNWTPAEDPAPTNWILINQGLDNFYIPEVSSYSFNDLELPYIEGKTLHFFVYVNGVKHEWTIEDFTEISMTYTHYNFPDQFWFLSPGNYNNQQGHYVSLKIDGTSVNTTNSIKSGYINNSNINYNGSWYCSEYKLNPGSGSTVSFNLPTLYSTSISFNSLPTNLGVFNNSRVTGNGNIYLKGFSYTPQNTPQPFPENPVPINSIPEDPDNPIPNTDPDPVPGIEYPVNPTPPPLRPVPSIVSGNDDLWPSVVELQNIEFDLSSYISGLGDFEFPDLTSITESFAGSIVWVSALMSSLFNGSDFSILFAVLSSFFIVAALLGLYKWWNHK